jgi:hypothetical protein
MIFSLTLQCGGFKHPVHTVVWEGFSSGHLNFELNCAGVFSKYCSFINSGWILMKLETEYLGMSKLFKYAIKSYPKNLTWCGMP